MLLHVLNKILRKPAYSLIGGSVSLVAFAGAVWLPNIPLLWEIMNHPNVALGEKLSVPISLLGSIATNFTLFTATYTILIAILIGLNVATAVYLVQHRVKEMQKNGIATGMLGVLSGIFGIGCAACGTLLLTSGLSIIGATWILSYLPLHGAEFGILAVLLLTVSLYITLRNIKNPRVCVIT
ncbi:hypothetical protein EPO56_00370 [Patescibacteria group bacterium]|nr:MAG: hypothetical protein EPO56_00370 [Patescibacteria group bacterium]